MLALADGIVRSPNSQLLSDAVLVARTDPFPMLGALGRLANANLIRLLGLAEQLDFTLSASRYIDWQEVESSVARLGERLVSRFGSAEVRDFRYDAIPRGGYIVLGLLSYVLGLSLPQLTGRRDPAAPVVVVDDCSLTGLRFREYLSEHNGGRFIFSPLFAHPDLCSAIESSEPRVVACLPADYLRDWAPQRYGERYAAWRRRWESLGANRPYWQGRTDHISFPWSEPQTRAWNPETGEIEPGWEFLPAHLCLKHRHTPRTDGVPPPQLVSPGPGPIRPADRVLWARFDDAYIVALMPAIPHRGGRSPQPETTPEPTPCLRLEGTAADMWDALLERGTVEGATATLADVYDVDLPTLRRDLANFVTTLQNDGILSGA